MDDETLENLRVRISDQMKMGNIAMGVCYRQSEWEELVGDIFRQLEEAPCSPSVVLIWCFNHPVAVQAG